jgi:hypothetical protein
LQSALYTIKCYEYFPHAKPQRKRKARKETHISPQLRVLRDSAVLHLAKSQRRSFKNHGVIFRLVLAPSSAQKPLLSYFLTFLYIFSLYCQRFSLTQSRKGSAKHALKRNETHISAQKKLRALCDSAVPVLPSPSSL